MSTPEQLIDLPVPSGPPVDENVDSGRWPRMLNLDEETEGILKQWLDNEIRLARVEKQDIVEDWKKWQMQYWAQPIRAVKNFPFRRAANFVVPLTAIAVEAVHARLMTTIFAVEPFWSIRPRTKPWIEGAKPLEKWLQTEVENGNSLSVYEFANDALTELIKMGTVVGKSGYEKRWKKTLKPTENGKEEPFYVEIKNGSTMEYVPLANFLIRMAEHDPQESSWVGEEHIFTWGQMKSMAQAGRMEAEAVEAIKNWRITTFQPQISGDAEDYRKFMDELQQTEFFWHERFRVQEIWASFDIDKDGEDEEIVIDWHQESRTILSIRFNWYADLHRPYRVTQYVKVEGRIWGIGIGKQNEQFQEAITTIHRQRVDNATLANMRMMAVKKQSGISPDEPIFPGKLWFVDDPQRDIQVIQLSEVYRSAFENESVLLNYSERRTGVNDVILGLPAQGTPGTATGDLARIAEGNKRFDLVLKNIRRWFGFLGQDVLANYQQFGDQQRHFLVLGNDGTWVEEFIKFPQNLVAKGAIVELTATSSQVNRQVEQQTWLSLFSILTQYYDRVIQLGQLIAQFSEDPTILFLAAQRAVVASDEAIKRMLETFDITDTDRFLISETPDDRPTGDAERAPESISGERGGRVPVGPNAAGVEPVVRGPQGVGGNGAPGSNLGGLAARGLR